MRITSLQLKHFRCFEKQTLHLDAPIVLLEGVNGSGKTSVLEALHYLCYLKSFRTHLPKDLIMFGKDDFFIKATFSSSDILNELRVGFCPPKRSVRIDKKAVGSYKELLDYYRVVSLVEDDLELIKGGPEVRRSFIDQAILLADPSYLPFVKKFRHVVDNRNALLRDNSLKEELHSWWTQKLWELSVFIANKRKKILLQLHEVVDELLKTYFGNSGINVSFNYRSKNGPLYETFQVFDEQAHDLYDRERRLGRSLFGAHLDDFSICFGDKKSKSFASRGQQKLTVILIKIAQIKQLQKLKGSSIFLLDDFMTDFDSQRVRSLLPLLLDLDTQLIFTSPVHQTILVQELSAAGGQLIKLTC